MKHLSKGEPPVRNKQDDEIMTFHVSILGKDYQVSCPASEQEDLIKAASQYDKRMREIKDTGKVIGLERIAVMTGLNIMHDLLQAKDKVEGQGTTDMLTKLNRKLDNAIQSAKQFEI